MLATLAAAVIAFTAPAGALGDRAVYYELPPSAERVVGIDHQHGARFVLSGAKLTVSVKRAGRLIGKAVRFSCTAGRGSLATSAVRRWPVGARRLTVRLRDDIAITTTRCRVSRAGRALLSARMR